MFIPRLGGLHDEDRSTAKKFLAAANFIELLSVFDVPNQSEVRSDLSGNPHPLDLFLKCSSTPSPQNETKIRYSKWKAADIAKAIREGRQPTPGPAGSTFEDAMIAPQSGAASPTPSAPPAESLFGSIPPSISASPLRAASQLPPLPVSPTSRPVEEIEPEEGPWKGASGDDATPVGSPQRAKKALSPERPVVGSSRISRSNSPPSHRSSKDSSPGSSAMRAATSTSSASPAAGVPAKSAPQTPRATKSASSSSLLKPGASPSTWSTLATPGMDDKDGRGTPLALTHTKGNGHVNGVTGSDTTKKIGGFLSRLYGTPSSGSAKTTSPANGHVYASANGNGALKHSYIVEEPGDDDDDDDGDGSVAGGERGGNLPPIYPSSRVTGDSAKRQDSWSSTVATRGDAPSRSSSWGFDQSPSRPSFAQEDSDEEGSDVAGDSGDVRVVSKEAATSLARVPSIALPPTPLEILASDTANTNNPDEASDVLAPLPVTKPPPPGMPKRVHFTPSVVGGLSSAASSSPPPSPSGTLLSLGSRVPLPPSDSSDTASSDEQRVIVGNGDMVLTTSKVDEPPPEEYHVPQPPLSSLPTRSETPTKESPPRLPSVPLAPAGSHNRAPSGGTIPLSAPDSAEDSSSPGSLSPRLRSTIVPPISATHHHHILTPVPTGPTAPAPSSASSSSSVTAPPLPPPPLPMAPAAPGVTTEFSAAGPTHSSKYQYPPTPYRPANLLSLSSPSTVTPPALPQAPLPDVLDAQETNRAKKHARFAISALEYDDPDTARKELVNALKVLGVNVSL